MVRFLQRLALALAVLSCALHAANLGTAINVIGQATDLVYDSQRNLVYIANLNQNRIEVYSVSQGRLLNPINVGNQPISLAISPDKTTLYIANSIALGTITLVDLASQAARDDIPVNARPDAMAVGNDGLVLILGSVGLQRLDPVARSVTTVAGGIPASSAPGSNIGGGIPSPTNLHASLSATPDGRLIFGMSNTRAFVYEVSSGTVLRSRNAPGLSAVTAPSPDGSRFMAGSFLFNATNLTILGNAGLPATTLTGGSVFSPDGNSVYASYSTQTAIWPLNTNNPQVAGATRPPGSVLSLGVLQQLKSTNLSPKLGIRLPDAITGKIIRSDDGTNLFALSASGMLVVPISRLATSPVLTVDKLHVVVSADVCNKGVQTLPARISNTGSGRMTYTAIATQPAAVAGQTVPTVILSQPTGLAPGSVNLTFDPQALTSTAVKSSSVANIILVSPEAVNIEPTIAISLNYRDVDQHGTIVPIVGTVADIVMDPVRNRVYLADSLNGQIQVWDIGTQQFLSPVEVGAQPHTMALTGTNLLVVANGASENISVVDLDQLQQIQMLAMGPFTTTSTPAFPNSIASSNNAILFATLPLAANGAAPGNGAIWQASLINGTAFVRPDLGQLNNATQANVVDNRTVLASAGDGSGIVIVSAVGGGTIRLYDPSTDSFPLTKTAQFTLRGSVAGASDGSYYIVDSTVFSRSLSLIGTIAATPAGTTTVDTIGASPTQLYRVRTGATAAGSDTRMYAERLALSTLTVNQSQPLVESAVQAWPAAPRTISELYGRAMVIDASATNAYIVTTSGMSIVPLTVAAGATPVFPANGVVNGASFKGLGVAPGSIISIFGTNLSDTTAAASNVPLPTVLNGTCVTINDVGMPLFYVSPTQINAQLPLNTAAGRVTIIVRSRNTGKVSNGVTVSTVSSNPGIFTAVDNKNRTVAAIYHNSNNTLVTQDNQAFRDEILVMYLTGLGSVTPAVPAGQAAPDSPLSNSSVTPSVCIGQHSYIMNFSGLAPGFVGLYQIDFTVPGDRVQGLTLPVVVTQASDCTTASTTGAPVTAIR